MRSTLRLVVFLSLVVVLSGCSASTGGQNKPVRAETLQVKANLEDAQRAIGNARNFVQELLRRFQAHLDNPALNPLPTTQETVALLNRADGSLGAAQDSGKKAGKGMEKVDAVADKQQGDFDRKIKEALDKQQAWYDLVGSLFAAGGIGLVVFLLIERFTGYTYLVALGPAVVAGALTFVLFNKFAHAIMELILVAKWYAIIGGTAWLVWYAWMRIKKHGGLKAAFTNVELKQGE